ncbi:TraR/DksA family transcriptional regulator [Noviherbaspirillum sp.]|uniref:TraR/DksA family transcriptional regulator n=1 Tax=Noviherbaspirillum sp. TaxID=1926288 RepID=UPI002D2DD30C|nr:TraR/DksA family transcriptional regulator [Noviherbaspirillum sp.]HZW21090.1 TraR/DksA family transcriptional regulator [Noviherbaspirillum sp.]
MSNLSEGQLAELKRMLDGRYKELSEELHREVNGQDDYLDLATEVPDPGDSSFANLSVDLGNAAITRDISELRAIEAARSRMENGTYGDCVNCETEIPYERLKVQPTAERCAPCQEAWEKSHAEGGRGATM